MLYLGAFILSCAAISSASSTDVVPISTGRPPYSPSNARMTWARAQPGRMARM